MTNARSRYGAADIQYVAAFDADVSPARLRLAMALADTAWTPRDPDRLTVLDIGCGRGVTALLLAAGNPGWEVIGLDLQPAHVAEAREIAAEAGIGNARFIEADLAEFDEAHAARVLPPVDIVICRGVWTWVPDVVRAGIVALLRSRVKPGGVVVMGYNALPGYASCIVLQRLLHEAVRDIRGSEAERGAAAVALLEQLREIGSPYLPPPRVLEEMIARGRSSPAYMAHQWFTGFWRPVFHEDLARDLAAARLDYAGQARPSTGMAEFQMRPQARQASDALRGMIGDELARDLFLDRRFRSDIFVRGRQPGGHRMLGGFRFALAGSPEATRPRLRTQSGLASLPPDQERAMVDALAAGPASLAELAAQPWAADLDMPGIAVMLSETYAAHPLWRDPVPDAALAARAARCNRVLGLRLSVEAMAGNAPLGAVCPALGGAFPMAAVELAVVVALQSGVPPDPEILARDLAPDDADPQALADLREEVARTLALHLRPWRDLRVV